MTFVELYNYLKSATLKVYDQQEATSIARILFEHFAKVRASEAFCNPNGVCDVEISLLESVIVKVERACPLQYILGYAWLGDLEFAVSESVLIPRPETEELVRWVVGENPNVGRLLDIGTGSGCIAVSCALMMPNTQVCAVDVSQEALAVARINAEKHNAKVQFLRMDILTEVIDEMYDVIVSNPPYVTESERTVMRKNVLDYEPELALFVPDSDPLRFYERIARLGQTSLNDGGKLYFEINESFGNQIIDMLKNLGYINVELRRDIFDRDRMVRAIWNQKC